MKPNKSDISDYFSFSKKERNAVFFLLILMVIFIILPRFFITEIQPPTVERQLLTQLDSVDNTDDAGMQEAVAENRVKNEDIRLNPFPFDPNLIDEAGWRKFGIREKTIQTIMNYRNKGGHFRAPEDIRKIYGLKKEEADALIPFVTIQQKPNRTGREDVGDRTPLSEKANYAFERKSTETSSISRNSNPAVKKININTATEEEWKSLPGIGEVLSKRIIKFRTSVGGFKSVEDIKKTYGLKDSVFEKIKPMLFLEE